MEDKEFTEHLFKDFPEISTKEWEEKIISDLKGADYRKKLIWETAEGFEVKPYYREEDLRGLEYLSVPPGRAPYTRGVRTENNRWIVRQDIQASKIESMNMKALDAIRRGADDIGLDAVEVTEHKQIHQLLEGINLEKTGIHFTSSRSYPLSLELFIYEVAHRGFDPLRVKGSMNFDFISYLLRHGEFYISQESNTEEAVYLLDTVRKKLPGIKAFTINGHLFRESGSTIVQELAFALASGNEYINLMKEKGFETDAITPCMLFSFSVGSDYFLEIAKLRAARLLWAKVVEQHQPLIESSREMYVHARTALWNKTIYDLYVNMLRTTTEGMSAVLGNANSVSIAPFDHLLNHPAGLGERMARNQQLIMREEAYLDKIIDPAAGSYYIETLTDSIAQHAWDLFLAVEEMGGAIRAIKQGYIQGQVAEAAKAKVEAIAQRKLVLLGTNQYPNIGETISDQVSDIVYNDTEDRPGTYPVMRPFRAASAFETVRMDTDRYIRNGNKAPTVFLFTFGNLAMLRARAAFTTNFFGCAGYRILDNPGFTDLQEGIRLAVDSGAQIVVLCSSDEEYSTIAATVCAGIKGVSPETQVIIAGYPRESVEELKSAGIDDFIHIRSNLLVTLEKYNQKLGIK